MRRWPRRHWGRPPWWPESEPWPPVHRRPPWRRGRARFVRRIALAFGVFLFLSALGASTLVSMLVRGSGLPGTAVPGALIILLVLFLAGSFSLTMRRAMTARLESQDRRRRELLADIAHELRTPLSVIQGRLEGILDGVYPPDDAQITLVLSETRMLARLVDDLRTLAQAESGTLTLKREPTDVAILTQAVVDSFSAQAASLNVSCRLEAPPDLPVASVDPLRLREILGNLISNALRHTPAQGGISIEVGAAGDRVVVKVADTGCGIVAEDLPKIFDRFFKGASSRGSGLGLAIARDLVAAHGGEIHAESRPGLGTTITFSLPMGD
jgi:two-component system sensor histidine kinase BaeS